MKIPLKTTGDLKRMRESCRMTAEVLQKAAAAVQPGVATSELDQLVRQIVERMGARPSFLGYHGFPGALCVSINDEVIHGIPGSRIIMPGDIVSLDVGVFHRGFHGDSALTIATGVTDPRKLALVETTRIALERGLSKVGPGVHLSDVSHAIEMYVREGGCNVVRDFVGHGIGKALHEDPQIPNFGKPGRGPILKPGMTLAIEPMVNLGTGNVRILQDQWTVVTGDGESSAHFEHTVLVTDNGVEILTQV